MRQLALVPLATFAIIVAPAVLVARGGSAPAVNEPPSLDLAPLGISPTDATNIADPAKQALWSEEYARELTAVVVTPLAVGSPHDPGRPTPLPVATGILPDGNPMGGMVFKNSWYGELNGERVAVRAGRASADGTGVIAVEYSTPGRLRIFQAPVGSGDLKLLSESGGVFQVVAASVEGFVFNLNELSLSSSTPALSTNTPEPASTSIAAS